MYIDLTTIDLCPGQGGGVNPSGVLNITENGWYDVYSFAEANVDVPVPQFVTETLNVSVNNTYYPGPGINGFSEVIVDVPITGWDQKNLTEGTIEIINIDNSASFVAENAFYNKDTIITVNLPYATSVGASAFYNCNGLTQVNLPVCSYIGNNAFYKAGLTQVNLPVCTIISSNAFTNCMILNQVSLPMCEYIDTRAFNNCYGLNQVSLPMCSSIGSYAFNSCSELSQISLPMCKYINMNAFYSCISLTQLSLPVCSYIGANAFRGCLALSIITIGYSDICSLGNSSVFLNTPIASGTGSIYVPTSLVDSYKSAKNWSKYSTQIFPISE